LEKDGLSMPFSAFQAISLCDPEGIQKMYSTIAKVMNIKIPDRDFNEIAGRLKMHQSTMPDGISLGKAIDLSSLDPPDRTFIEAIDQANFGWTLCFIAEDQSDRVAELTNNLQDCFSDNGNGKCFASGFSYWGIGPTIAWERASSDPFYLVMKNSLTTFPQRWANFLTKLDQIEHYVSLGVGTGQKDRQIMYDFLRRDENSYFFPVDMSGEMLRLGVGRCFSHLKEMRRSQVLPIQIDFSKSNNVRALFNVVTSVIKDAPVLYSLLGNTLANFDKDENLLKTLTSALRKQDKMLLEVAVTREVSAESAAEAADEYKRSMAFFPFVKSALENYTNLNAKRENIDFLPTCIDGKAIEIRTVFVNRQDAEIPIQIPTAGCEITLKPSETIRLYLTRKYLTSRIYDLVEAAHCTIDVILNDLDNSEDRFGLATILISKS
ncbi:MAG TPA: L-histidine N(alpha)-methyltransferase, partial [Bdellovibrio sp.]|nr:L-histidine N(alpha)-methyltransferase [Bdellovibrio sp.]